MSTDGHSPRLPANATPPGAGLLREIFAAPLVPDYKLLKRIGSGSYGAVWLARNATGSYRAVKVIYRATFESDKPYEREFSGIKEFEPISRSHPSQVDILHVGRNDAAGYFYYVMELADDCSESRLQAASRDEGAPAIEPAKAGTPNKGRLKAGLQTDQPKTGSATATGRINPDTYEPTTLRTVLKEQGRLPVNECLNIAAALAEALEHLHAHGLVHRDIKPSNIIFVNGRPKLADIGLVARADATLSFVGTEGYLPPEGPGKPQADIFSLGKVLYEMASGKDRHQFPDPPTLLKELPDREAFQELNEVILRACAHDATERYQSAAEMHAELVSLRAGKSLKRSRLLERRLGLLTKLTAVGIAVSTLVVTGYFYQQRQTQKANRLAAELQINQGIHAMDEGDLSGALLWFVQALEQARWTKEEIEIHRFRLGAVLRHCPKLVQLFVPVGGTGSVDFSPDGRRLLTYQFGRDVQISDVASGGSLVILRHSNLVWQAVFSANGTRVLTASGPEPLLEANAEGEARVWNANTGQPISPSLRHEGRVFRAVFSPDGGRVLTGSDDGTAQVWDAVTGAKLGPPLKHGASVTRVAFALDGNRVITLSTGGTARLWNSISGEEIVTALQHPEPVLNMGVSANGQHVLTASEQTVFLWDAQTGRQLLPPLRHSGGVLHVQFSPDAAKILAMGSDGSAQIWDAVTGERFPAPPNRKDWTTSVHFSPDGRFVATVAGDNVVVWEAETGALATSPLVHNGWIWGLRFHPDGSHVATTSSSEGVVRLWDLRAGQFAKPAFAHTRQVTWASFSPDGHRILTASRDGTARLWDPVTGKGVTPALKHRGFQHYGHPSISRDGKRALTASSDNTVQVWDAATGEPVTQPLPHQATIHHAEFSPDGKLIVTATDEGTIQLWDASTGQPVGPAAPKLRGPAYASFSPDGRRLATIGHAITRAFEAQVLDLVTGQSVSPPMQGELSPNYSVSFSPDASHLLTRAFNGDVRVWDAHTGRPITPVLTHNRSPIYAACFSPDGRHVLTSGTDRSARLWDAATGRQLTGPLKHGLKVRCAAFSPDGRRIVTASEDQTARIWDASTGLPLTPPLQHGGVVRYAEFSPEGRRVITACDDGTARVWEFEPVTWPVEDLRLLARLQSGRTIDATGSFSALSPTTLKEILLKLKVRHPDYFRDWPPK